MDTVSSTTGGGGAVSPFMNTMNLNKIMQRSKPPLRKLTIKQSMLHPTFWHIFFMLLLSMAFSDFMKPQMKYYGSTIFDDDLFLTMVGILAFLSSSLAKFAWGAI